MINFKEPAYLLEGNLRQQRAYHALAERNVFNILKRYNPILVGTIPINIDIPGSDLDILCCWGDNKEMYRSFLSDAFGKMPGFEISESIIRGEPSIVAKFRLGAFEVEIFAQRIPSDKQNGYRHMVIEHCILLEKGEAFRRDIIGLKTHGMKTEPAFAKLLNLTGDPYKALLKFGNAQFPKIVTETLNIK